MLAQVRVKGCSEVRSINSGLAGTEKNGKNKNYYWNILSRIEIARAGSRGNGMVMYCKTMHM